MVLECLFIKFGEAKQFLHGGFVRLVLVKSWFLCVVFDRRIGYRKDRKEMTLKPVKVA